jgi:hypothetical protein
MSDGLDPRLGEAKRKLDELKELSAALKRDGIELHIVLDGGLRADDWRLDQNITLIATVVPE